MAKKMKKDFDKEQMYRKIMPSIAAPEPDEPPEPEPPEPAGVPRLHNFMEDMLLDKLERTAKVLQACDCERCRQDIMVLALNQLPPAYAVAAPDDARQMRKLRGAYEVKVTASLIKAIQQVKSSPRHHGGWHESQQSG